MSHRTRNLTMLAVVSMVSLAFAALGALALVVPASGVLGGVLGPGEALVVGATSALISVAFLLDTLTTPAPVRNAPDDRPLGRTVVVALAPGRQVVSVPDVVVEILAAGPVTLVAGGRDGLELAELTRDDVLS